MTKKLFIEYVAESECSLVISSHNLSELSELCDNVGLINGKQLVMDCSVYDISKNYSKIRLIFDRDVTENDFKNIKSITKEILFNCSKLAIETKKSYLFYEKCD